MSEECLRTGDKAVVHFRFIKHPEYLKSGQRLVFREGRTKAVGNVLRVFPSVGSKMSIGVPLKQHKMLSFHQQVIYLIITYIFKYYISKSY